MEPTLASKFLSQLQTPDGASVARQEQAVVLTLQRDSIRVTVTVPLLVREWFVDVSEASTGAKIHDYCDYDGYDEIDLGKLDADMARDVEEFVEKLLQRDLRMAADGKRLEWAVSESWQQAVPFVSEAT